MCGCIPALLSCCYKGNVKDFSEIPSGLSAAEEDASRVKRWNSRFQAFSTRIRWFGASGSIPSNDDLVIALLLSLYSGESDKWERAQQESAISRDLLTIHGRDPATVEFYIPQLCTFLTIQQFMASDVQDFLLSRFCRCDLRLAHRVYWHLMSFCTNKPYARVLKYKVEMEGHQSATVFNERLHAIDVTQIYNIKSDAQSSIESRSQSRDVSKEREKNVQRRLLESECSPEETTKNEFKSRSPSVGSSIADLASAPQDRDSSGGPQYFQSGLFFIEALTNTSEELVSVPLAQRQDEMVSKLEKLNEFFLSEKARMHGGSDVIYVPFGSHFYQVLSINTEESIAFSTKERVPMLVCLEVRAIPLEELTPLRCKHRGRGEYAGTEESSLMSTWKVTIANNISSLKEKFPLEFTHRLKPSDAEREAVKSSEPERETEAGLSSPSKTQLLSDTRRSSDQQGDTGLSHLGQWRDAPPNTKVVDKLMRALTDTFGTNANDLEMSPTGCLDQSDQITRKDSFFKTPEVDILRDMFRSTDAKEKPLLTPDDDYNKRIRSYSAAMEGRGFFIEGGGIEPEVMQRATSIDEKSSLSFTDSQDHNTKLIFREQWSEKENRLWNEKKESAGPREGWMLLPVIVKANDDLRQEQAVSQMVHSLHRIFSEGDVGVWLRPYEILATCPTAGILEAVPDTVSLHALKRNAPGISLPEFFKRHFGAPGGVSLKRARSNFVESCAGYAIVCYLLQVKDRHNGNILLDSEGHLLHIDWGFVLGQSPGHNFGFESAPFKLTSDHVEVMGGPMSFSFQRFRNLCVRAFLEARRNREKIILLVEMLAEGYPELPCFSHSTPSAVCEALRQRFLPEHTTGQCVEFVIRMIDESMASWSTPLYDNFQRCCVGIF